MKPEIHPLSGSPLLVRFPQMTIPNRARRNISWLMNLRANLVNSGVNSATQMMLMIVPKNDAPVATKIVSPAFPCKARG